MSISNYDYEADWRPYVFPKEKKGFTSQEEIEQRFTKVLLGKHRIKMGGIPIISDGQQAIIDDRTVMSLIYGTTGSKKTRTLIAQTIAICAEAGESMIIPDIKGEFSNGPMSTKIRGKLEKENYRTIFLDFRSMLADGFNILEIPYKLYRNGQKDEASQLISELVKGLSSIYKNSKADPFWEETAKSALEAIILLIFRVCDNLDYINMHSVKTFTSDSGCYFLEKAEKLFKSNDLVLTKLRSILAEPEKTRSCTLSTINTFIDPFLSNEKLSKMLSYSTFDIKDLFQKKTALFIILPDEHDTYERICGLILQQINSTLILEAYKENGSLPRRVNFICDEFCNYRIPHMSSNISASRSRNIRWFIVCQSQKQLKNTYRDDADVIIANCENIFFLNSTEISLLQELSDRAGYTKITHDGTNEPIISVQDLQSLKKGWDYTDVFFASRDIVFVTSLPDISKYAFLQRFKDQYHIPIKEKPKSRVFTPELLYHCLLSDIDIEDEYDSYVDEYDDE